MGFSIKMLKFILKKENLNIYNKNMRTMMECGFAQEERKIISSNICGIRERMLEGKVFINCTRFLWYAKDENVK